MKKPNHKINLIKYVLPKIMQDEKCNECGKDIKKLETYKNCDDCNTPLCDDCENKHKVKNPNHKIRVVKRKYNKKDVIESYCALCNKNIPINNNDNINYCDDCGGNICKDCNKNHNKKYPIHKIKIVKYIYVNDDFIDEKNEKYLLKCANCKKDLKNKINQPIQFCTQCNGNICYECEKEHIKRKLNHKLYLTKYIINKEKKYNCNQCGISLEGDDNYNGKINSCDKCLINLCDNCTINHKKNHPNHNIKVIKRKIYKETYLNDSDVISDNLFKDKNKCMNCKKYIYLRNGQKINYCVNCKENLCDVCKDLHYANNPGHKVIYVRVILFDQQKDVPRLKCKICDGNLNEKLKNYYPIDFCNNCQGNLCNKCALRHVNEFPTHQSDLKIYLPDYQSKIYYIQGYNCIICGNRIKLMNNRDINICSNCNGYICQTCENQHNNNYPEHDYKYLNTIITEKNKDVFDIPKLNCISCKKNLDYQINGNINFCGDCNGVLCKECCTNHRSKNPKHILKVRKYVFVEPDYEEEKEYDGYNTMSDKKNKCIICKKKVIKKNDIDYCNKCMGILCDSCNYNHDKDYPGHKLTIKVYKNIKDKKYDEDSGYNYAYNIPNYKCLLCKEEIPLLENGEINHCSGCKGNLCVKCLKLHNYNNSSHKIKIIKVLIYKVKSYQPNSACISCGDKINNDYPFYKCEDCQGDLCNKCLYIHSKSSPNHKFYLTRYLIDSQNYKGINCKLCNKNLEKEQNNYCDSCYINLCDKCINIHNKKYPNHIIKYNQKNISDMSTGICIVCHKYLDKNSNYCNKCRGYLCLSCCNNHENNYQGHYIEIKDNNKGFEDNELNNKNNRDLPMKVSSDHCNTCGILLTNKINLGIHNCYHCNGYFCNKCINSHYKLYPEHNKINIKNSYQAYDSENRLNITSGLTSKCNLCQKYLNIKSGESTFYCNQCKIKLCKECSHNHNNQYTAHTITILKTFPLNINEDENSLMDLDETNKINYNLKTERSDRDINCSCLMCKVPHSKCPSRYYYTCTDCNNYICNLCKKKHDIKFYSHILVYPHKYGEEMNKINKRKKASRRFASVGDENYTNKRKGIDNENLSFQKNESESLPKPSGSNYCFKCKKMNKILQICQKCKKLYCQKCIKIGEHNCQ